MCIHNTNDPYFYAWLMVHMMPSEVRYTGRSRRFGTYQIPKKEKERETVRRYVWAPMCPKHAVKRRGRQLCITQRVCADMDAPGELARRVETVYHAGVGEHVIVSRLESKQTPEKPCRCDIECVK
jgi:hypothetical protein